MAHIATSRTCDHGMLGLRVEVDAQLVGVVEVAAADRPRVEVDVAEVRRPDQVRGVDGDELGRRCGPPGSVTVAVWIHSGALLRHALLEERLALDAVDAALEDRRALPQPEQRRRRRTPT